MTLRTWIAVATIAFCLIWVAGYVATTPYVMTHYFGMVSRPVTAHYTAPSHSELLVVEIVATLAFGGVVWLAVSRRK